GQHSGNTLVRSTASPGLKLAVNPKRVHVGVARSAEFASLVEEPTDIVQVRGDLGGIPLRLTLLESPPNPSRLLVEAPRPLPVSCLRGHRAEAGEGSRQLGAVDLGVLRGEDL